ERHGEGGVLAGHAQALGDLLGERHGAHGGAGDEGQLDGGPGALEELQRVDLRDAGEQGGVDAEHHDEAADVDVGGEGRVLADQVPAVGGDGVDDEAGGADRGEADDPPQGILEQREDRLAEGEDGLRLLAELEGGDAGDGGHEDDLEHVQFGERRDDVGGDDAGEEVDPGAGLLGLRPVGGGQAGARARVGDQADDEADGHRDQRRDHEPEEGAGRQAGRVVDLPQVGDGHQDREEDQGGDGQLQQADEGAADLLEGGDQPGDVLAAGGPAQPDAEDEAGEYLGPERRLEGQPEGLRVRGHGHAPTGGRGGGRGRGTGEAERQGRQFAVATRQRSTCRRATSGTLRGVGNTAADFT